jgi:hypothetical protein
MLTVINLYVIDKIINEVAECKLSINAKMLYVNCLTHYFKNKKPTVANAVAFEIFKNDIPLYNKHERTFEELHKAGLVIVGINAVSFNNCWGQHINRSLLDKVSPQEFVAGFQFQSPEQFKEELLKNQTLHELVSMKYKISSRQLESLIGLFVTEQTTFDKKYQNFADCIKHFTYWIPHNLDKTTKENVKSNGKWLGE